MRVGGRVPPNVVATDNGASIEQFTKLVKLADKYGYTKIWPGDGQTQMECLTTVGYMASITNRVRVGARVVNPLTREPGVMANALATIHVISGGRAFMVLGRGDGAVRNHGFKEAGVQQIKEYYVAVRELLEQGETVYRGRTIRFELRGIGHFKGKDKIPLYIITSGPRTLKLAGAIADGIWVAAGLTPEIINDSMGKIREGAREVGRDPAEIDIWWVTRSSVERTMKEAVAHAKESLASIGNHSLRGSFEGKQVPIELQPKIKRYHELYDWKEKGLARGNVALMEELGLLDYFMQRYGVVGTPEEVVARLKYLKSLGVEQCELAARNTETIRLIGEEVIPAIA